VKVNVRVKNKKEKVMTMGSTIDMQKMSNDMKQIVFGTLPAHEREVLAYAKDAQCLMTLRKKLKSGVNISKEEAKRAADICLRYFDVFSVDNGLKKYKAIDYYKTGVQVKYLLKAFLYTVNDCLHEETFEKDNLIDLAVMLKNMGKLYRTASKRYEELEKEGKKSKSPSSGAFLVMFDYITKTVHRLAVHPEITDWIIACNRPIFTGIYVEPSQFKNVYYYNTYNAMKTDKYKTIDSIEKYWNQNLALAKIIALSKYLGIEAFVAKSSVNDYAYVYLPQDLAPYVEPIYLSLDSFFKDIDDNVRAACCYNGPVTNQFFDSIKILVDFFEDKLPGCISLESCKDEIKNLCIKEQPSERKKLADMDDEWMEIDR
jgi:hypothetical protein